MGSLLVYYGDETYMVDRKVSEIKNKIIEPANEAFGFQLLEGKTCLVDNLVNAVQTIPTFTPQRLVVIKNPYFLNSKKEKAGDAESEEDDDSEKEKGGLDADQEKLLLDNMSNIPDGVTVVWQVHGNIDLRRKIGKFLKANANELHEFPSFDRWDRPQVAEWLLKEARARDYHLDAEAADFLSEVAGHSLGALSNELDKIITYAGDNKRLTITLLKEVVSQGEASFFDMAEALRQKNIPLVLELVTRINKEGAPFQVVLGYLASQVRFLLQLKSLYLAGRSYTEIATAVRKHPFYVKKVLENEINRYTLPELESLFYGLQKADLNVKSGLVGPALALELAITELQKK